MSLQHFFSIIKTGKIVKKHHVTIYCNVIGSHCTVWWDKAHTLCSPDDLFFLVGGWLMKLIMTQYTVEKVTTYHTKRL